ncbi:unnamed protein product [Adineta ricciae]|uniref:N-acetyltransferase domain-containing protein n=1 Tax=Adineta ricciae TaxID=249248 RepID=A0A815KKC3_ADIRI|nr:unnamed protein product [Adineta ricciae]CAF1461917.1 unnamed protein product [Adineta ricciae]
MTLSIKVSHTKFPSLSLSPLVLDDASEMFVHLNDEETIKYLIGPPYPITIEQIRAYISSRPLVNGQASTFAIRDQNRMIGEVSLVPKTAAGTYELGYYLARPYWCNGIATAAVKTFLNEIHADKNTRIEAGYLADNIASEKILLKCGFTKIGYEQRAKNGLIYQGVKMVRTIVS